MENKKQTAVEWLVEQMFKQGYFDGNKPLSITNLDHLQHEAKEMEKQQIIDANEDASTNELGEFLTGKQYYNKKYGS